MPSADLIVDLSPPRSNKTVSLDLSPSTYIRDPEMLASLRRKASLDIGPQIHKKCTLEPPPIEEDRTILQYYDRVYESVSKEKLSVRISGQGIINLLNDGQECEKNLAVVIQQNEAMNAEHATQIAKLDVEIQELQAKHDALQISHDALKTFIAHQNEGRMKMYKANILADFVKKVFVDLHLEYPGKLEEVKETKKTRYAQAATSLSKRQLEAFFTEHKTKEDKMKYAEHYYKLLQRITEFIDGRNEAAHESHIKFARLLQTDQYRDKGDYIRWARLFKPVYGSTIEQIMDDLKAKEQEMLAEQKTFTF